MFTPWLRLNTPTNDVGVVSLEKQRKPKGNFVLQFRTGRQWNEGFIIKEREEKWRGKELMAEFPRACINNQNPETSGLYF